MITGIDISHHNYSALRNKNINGNGFVFLKATEGKTFVDNYFDAYLFKIASEIEFGGSNNIPFLGAYHYARPDNGNTVEKEVDHFLNTIKDHIDDMMLALDWENLSHNYGEKWALDWLRCCERTTGKKPFFYTSAAYLKYYPTIADEYPLWIACYSETSRTSKFKRECDKATILQVTSHPLDIDIFKGTLNDMYMYIKGGV